VLPMCRIAARISHTFRARAQRRPASVDTRAARASLGAHLRLLRGLDAHLRHALLDARELRDLVAHGLAVGVQQLVDPALVKCQTERESKETGQMPGQSEPRGSPAWAATGASLRGGAAPGHAWFMK